MDVLNDTVLSTEQGRRGNRRMELVFCLCTVFALLPLRERRCHRFRRHHASSSVPSRLGSFQLLAGRSTWQPRSWGTVIGMQVRTVTISTSSLSQWLRVSGTCLHGLKSSPFARMHL